MIEKQAFCKLLNNLEHYVKGLRELEAVLKVTFDANFLTEHIDRNLIALSESFFSLEELEDLENLTKIETVKDILYHYALTGDFGSNVDVLQRLYVEDEGLSTEFAMSCFSASELYELILRYLCPPKICKTYKINC